MRILLTIIITFCCALLTLNGQKRIHNLFEKSELSYDNYRNDKDLNNAVYSVINHEVLQDISNNDYPEFELTMPINNYGSLVDLNLVEFNLVTNDFKAIDSKGQIYKYKTGNYYTAVSEDNKSLGAFSFYKDKMLGIFSYENGDVYNLGRVNDSNGEYILFREDDFNADLNFYCDTDEFIDDLRKDNLKSTVKSRSDKCIEMYIEADYALYVANGKSLTKTIDYILGIFAETSLLYKKEGIEIKVATIKVWDSPDSYNTESSHKALGQFGDNNEDNDADLCLLLALGADGLGGVAWIGGLCKKNHFAYANIRIDYRNVPLYSWSAMVITHELGHNLGSPHTHACRWNGDDTQIDDCGNLYSYNNGETPEGNKCFDNDNPILPTDGGTIMSYCHLVGAIGINLDKGFGTQPGNLIRNYVANSDCIESCESYGDTIPVADFQVNDTISCIGGELSLVDKSLNHPTSWVWLVENGLGTDTFYHKFPIISYTDTGVFDIGLIASNAKGSSSKYEFDYITVLEGPTAEFSFDYLEKDKVQFTNNSTNSDSYFWRFGDGRISLSKNPKHTFKDGGKYVVELRSRKDQCKSDSYFIDTIEVKIPLIAHMIFNTSKICVGDTVSFNVEPSKYDSVKWIFQGGNIIRSNEEHVSIVYENIGKYDVTLISYSKYGQDTLLREELINVTQTPISDFEFNILNDTVVFTSLSLLGERYLWDFGDGNRSSQENPTHIYGEIGNFKVELTVENRCNSSVYSKDVIISTIGIEEIGNEDFNIFPNPNSGEFVLSSFGNFGNKVKVRISDIYGKLIFEDKNIKRNQNGNLRININNKVSGTYFIEIMGEKHRKIKKIIFL